MQSQQSNLNQQTPQIKITCKYILVVVLLLAAIVGGGFLSWRFQYWRTVLKEKTEILKQNEILKQEQGKLSAGWKDYSNQELGVAFSYPEFWGKVKLFQNQGPTECAMGQRIVTGTGISLSFSDNSSINLYFTSPDYKSALCLLNNKGESEEIVSGFTKTCEPYPLGISKVFECKSSSIANSSGISFYTADQSTQSCGYSSDKHIKFNSPNKNFSGVNIIASVPISYDSGCGKGRKPDITLEEFRDLRARQLKEENQLPFEARQFLWEFDNFIKTIKFI